MKFSGPGNWFSFYKGEQAGIFVLLVAALTLAVLPRFIYSSREPAKLEFAEDSATRIALIEESRQRDDSLNRLRYPGKKSLFRSSESDLVSMGFSKETARKIREKITAGKIHGYQELASIQGVDTNKLRELFYPISPKKEYKNTRFNPENPLELNSADTISLASLPGIGAKTAKRIVDYRNKLGGFYNKSQILEVRWTDSNALKQLLPSLYVDASQRKTINLEQASLETLTVHPYLSKKDAGLILAFCRQHNRFTAEDLKKHPGISTLAKKNMPYYLVFFNHSDN